MSANQSRPGQYWATAPGKVILSGEHGVVYGQSALAAAINLSSRVALTATATATTPVITIRFPATAWQFQATAKELVQLATEVQQRHQQFLTGQLPLNDIFASAGQLLPAALGYCVRENSLTIQDDITIELSTELLLGGGMGSSASLVAALLAALMTACACHFTKAQLYQQVLATEQWQHGRSSGLDPHVCVFGGLQLYQAGGYQSVELAVMEKLYLVSTGRPLASTGECVEAVRQQQHGANFWQQFGVVTETLHGAMVALDMSAMQAQIKRNQQLLQQLQVVPNKVAEFISAIEQLGAAAKICGAGSIAGDAGGLVLLAGLEPQQVADLCEDRDYAYWPLVWQAGGVTYGSA